jgi:hypothetical protein
MAISDIFPDAPAPTSLSTSAAALIDELLACHDEWLVDVATVDEAYRRWRAAPVAERRSCHGAYLAALDQEEASATTYEFVHRELQASLRSSR